jgi:hypothetical protein
MPPKKDIGPEPTVEALTAAMHLLKRAARMPAPVAEAPPNMFEAMKDAAFDFVYARQKYEEKQKLVQKREALSALVLADAAAREAEKRPIIERAEAAELALGQAVMKQERINAELEKAKAEIEKLRADAEGRKRKSEEDGAGAQDEAEVAPASESKKARK